MAAETNQTLSLQRYTAEARALVAGAQALADERHHPAVDPLHLLARLLDSPTGASEVLRAAGVDVVELRAGVTRALSALPTTEEPAFLSARLLDLLERAERDAQRERRTQIELDGLLSALSQEIRGPAGELLGAHGVAPGSLRPFYGALRRAQPQPNEPVATGQSYTDLLLAATQQRLEPALLRTSELRRLITILERKNKAHPLLVGEAGVGKGAIVDALAQRWAAGDVPAGLSRRRLLSLDVAQLFAGLRLRTDADERLRKLLASLSSEGEAVLVVSELDRLVTANGSSMAEVFEGSLAQGRVQLLGQVTPDGARRLADKAPGLLRWLTPLDIDELDTKTTLEVLRGIRSRLERHHRLTVTDEALEAAVKLSKRYLPERHLPESALDLLDEAAAARRVEFEGASASEDAQLGRLELLRAQVGAALRQDVPAERAARQVVTDELATLQATVQSQRERGKLRRQAQAELESLRASLTQAEQERLSATERKDFARLGELEHAVLPELAARLAQAETASAGAEAEPKPELDGEQVARTLEAWTGIPLAKMLEGESERLLQLEQRLEQRVVGQPEALSAIGRAVRRGRAGLRDTRRPIGSFLFLGPSGVGKTELAKALAALLFDDEAALTRLDMSEFMERHMAARLVGAPPGYADSEQGGFLTEAVRRRPFSVLLFDEVEKAHADVFNLLLQVLEDGRLTDARGRTADFSNTVIVMTSNIGSEQILDAPPASFESEEGRQGLRGALDSKLRSFFRPELLNRIDEILIFRPLSREVLSRIAQLQLAELSQRLAAQSLRLNVSDPAIAQLVELGYQPALGARPLRRAIARELADPLAEAVLSGRFAPGSVVHVSLDEQKKLLIAVD